MSIETYINNEGFAEYILPCGCCSTHVEGFGWTNIMCDKHQEEADYEYEPKITKFNQNKFY